MNEQPTHLDLFSGIGGFALAAGWAGFRTIGFCEIEPYCQAVLKKHWPQVPIHSDIRKLQGEKYRGCSLLTGGFPCQPYSLAGKRRGKNDDRHLWPEMFRIIQEAEPSWIIGENVAGIIGMELERVLIDLESENYETQCFIIPACAVNAPHKRERIWIVANRNGEGLEGQSWHEICERERERDWIYCQESCSGFMANAISKRTQIQTQRQNPGIKMFRSNGENRGYIKDPRGKRRRIKPGLCGVAYGVSRRVDRIRGLGNAIVPQVAYQILKGIKEVMEQNGEN